MTIRRLLSRLALIAAASVALAALSECSWATSYKLAISQVADDTAGGVTMTCAEDAVCRTQLPVQIDGKAVGLTVVSMVFPGNAYIRFEAVGRPIPVGSNDYAYVALGRNKTATTTIELQWPVERGTSPLLTAVHIAIVRFD